MLVELKVRLRFDFKFLELGNDIVDKWLQAVDEVRLLNHLDLLVALK